MLYASNDCVYTAFDPIHYAVAFNDMTYLVDRKRSNERERDERGAKRNSFHEPPTSWKSHMNASKLTEK